MSGGGITSATDGSLIFKRLAAGNTEVSFDLSLLANGGRYVAYFRASPNALYTPSGAVGTFYAVEISNVTLGDFTCALNLRLLKNDSSGFSVLSNLYYGCKNYLTVRVFDRGDLISATFDSRWITWWQTPNDLNGQPGVGVGGLSGNNSRMVIAKIGLPDTTPPAAVGVQNIGVTAVGDAIEMQWQQPSDGPTGTGVVRYDIVRTGMAQGQQPAGFRDDFGIQPNTTYTYTLTAIDHHWNYSQPTTFTVTTPPASTIDIRRTGVQPLGVYWGAGPEQIDVRTGNVNYTMLLVRAQSRGFGVNFALNYNSQQWRKGPAGDWRLGRDTGFGFGWRFLAGAITPYYRDYWALDHYKFTDSTGAEYKLMDPDGDGVWRSTQGIHVYYQAATDRLFFPDGSFWHMSCVSGGEEADIGTRYPMLMQDSNGNQIHIRYQTGRGEAYGNSSSRITEIEDVRAKPDVEKPGSYLTYRLTYTAEALPHLGGLHSNIGSGETLTFGYLPGALSSPHTAGSNFGSTQYLQWVKRYPLPEQTFEYGAGGELLKSTTPLGGYLRWTYRDNLYSGGRIQREVEYRYMKAGVSQPAETQHYSRAATPRHGRCVARRCCTIRAVTGAPGRVIRARWAATTTGCCMNTRSGPRRTVR